MPSILTLLDTGYLLDDGWYLDSLLDSSVASYEWVTDFATPATLTGLVLTPDTDRAAIDAVVSASIDPYHEAYVWETLDEDGEWDEIERTADPALSWSLAHHNQVTRIRVSDWTGTADTTGYSETIEAETTLVEWLWWMVSLVGDDEYTTALRYVLEGETVEDPLDQVILQPLSGPTGEVQPPIVITGQRQGERLSLSLFVDDPSVIRLLQRSSRLPVGAIALKDPNGPVYIVATGSLRIGGTPGSQRQVEMSATRVA